MSIKKVTRPLIRSARKLNITLLLFIMPIALNLTGSATANPHPSAVLTTADLRDALAGKQMGHRGILREGTDARTFAEGYIAATAEAAAASRLWCGIHRIKAHELTSQVYERLTNTKPSTSAGAAINAALKSMYPCSRK